MALVQGPVQRQSSQTSSTDASERILALGSRSQKPVEPLAPVDLDDAEEHEEKLTSALGTVRESLIELMKECPLGESRACGPLGSAAGPFRKAWYRLTYFLSQTSVLCCTCSCASPFDSDSSPHLYRVLDL